MPLDGSDVSIELKTKALDLLNKGTGIRAAARILKVSHGLIGKWSKEVSIKGVSKIGVKRSSES